MAFSFDGAAKGAAAGSELGPWGTAAGAAFGGFEDNTGGSGGDSGPSRATSGTGGVFGFNNSGWTVYSGKSGGALSLPPWAWAIIAAGIGYYAWKLTKS